MIGWPEAVVICFVIMLVYGLTDTLLKRQYFEKRVGNMSIKMRGEEARVAMEHHNSMTVVGFGADLRVAGMEEPTSDELLERAAEEHKQAIDEASGERENLDGREYPELASTSARRKQ